MSNLIKEKAYKLLYEKYRSLYTSILYRANNVQEYGKDDLTKHQGLVTTIVDRSKYDYHGLQSKTDTAIVETLEYLLDDEKKVK